MIGVIYLLKMKGVDYLAHPSNNLGFNPNPGDDYAVFKPRVAPANPAAS